MTTIKEIDQFIEEMKSKAINQHRVRVAILSQTIIKSPSDFTLHAQLQTSLKRLDFLMSA